MKINRFKTKKLSPNAIKYYPKEKDLIWSDPDIPFFVLNK